MKISINFFIFSTLTASPSNGKQQDITFRLKDPATSRLFSYQARKGHGNVTNHEVKRAGDLELCFNNRHSMMESKKLVWEFSVTGEERKLEGQTEDQVETNKARMS